MSPFTIFFLYFVAFVYAAPLVKRDVVSPPITSPNASTAWNVGDKVSVTWDTTTINIPSNSTGTLYLGFMANNSENLMLDSPLAQKFPLTDGTVQVTVPDIPPKNNYIVVLLGDSGNASPEFSINGGSGSSSQPASTSSAPPSSPSQPPISTNSADPSSIPSTSTATVVVSDPASSGNPVSSPSSQPSISPSSPATNTTTSPVADKGGNGSNGAASYHLDALAISSFAGLVMLVTFFL